MEWLRAPTERNARENMFNSDTLGSLSLDEDAYIIDGKKKTSHNVEIVHVETIFEFHNPDFPRVTVDDGHSPRWMNSDRVEKLGSTGMVVK